MEHRRSCLESTLILGFLLCLLMGGMALAAFLWLNNTNALALADSSLPVIHSEQIVPSLAIRQLAGDPALALAYQALSAGELETARVILLYDTNGPAGRRATLLHQLAQRYQESGQNSIAEEMYQNARSIAILDPTVKVLDRSHILIQCAKGLFAVSNPQESLATAIQASRVGAQLPELLPVQRSHIFEELRPLARQLENVHFSQRMDELLRNPYLTVDSVLLPSRWSELAIPIEMEPALQSAVDLRQQAALIYADQLPLAEQFDLEPARQALSQALIAEDQIRTQFYQSRPAEISLHQQFWLLEQQRSWLLLKARTAMGGFGLSLVPEWLIEQQRIEQELSLITRNINEVLDALINQQATPIEQAMLRVEKLLWLALQIELNLYPEGSDVNTGNALRFAIEDLERQGVPLALPVGYELDSAVPGFWIQERR